MFRLQAVGCTIEIRWHRAAGDLVNSALTCTERRYRDFSENSVDYKCNVNVRTEYLHSFPQRAACTLLLVPRGNLNVNATTDVLPVTEPIP